MSTVLKLKWIVLLFLILIGGYFVGQAACIVVRRANLYAAGKTAAAAGDWPRAFSQFYLLTKLDPDYRDVRQRLVDAGRQTLPLHPNNVDVDTELKLLRWLAASGELEMLAEVLDRSMVNIPAGEFTMGCDTAHEDERPERQVFLDAFAVDRYEVTNVQYQRFVQETGEQTPRYWSGIDYPAGQADHPVVGVGWQQAQSYCQWVGKRLPSEAEWEKTCRGLEGWVYPWGEAWQSERANVGVATGQSWPLRLDDGWELLTSADPDTPRLQPVGSYPTGQSDYHVLDLVGNASEWVADWYNWDGYWNLPDRNPVSTEPPWNHSIRGSGWFDRQGQEDLVPDSSRCSARNSSHSYDDPRLGFRCARSIP